MSMKTILDFFLRLSQNNNKLWFDAHRAEYEALKKQHLSVFAMDFVRGVEDFDPRCHGLQLHDVTYRINRDIRFSNDKSPYKHWYGVYVCPRGKKSGMAGYYIHLEPATDTYFICAGLYNPTKEVLGSVREQIMLEPDEFHDAVVACGKGFELNWDNALKRMPVGWSENDRHSEYYRLKSYEICKPLTKDDILDKDFLPKALKELRKCQPFNEILNRCVDYLDPVTR